MEGKPPFGQENECSTENFVPQAQFCMREPGRIPAISKCYSIKKTKEKLYSSKGSIVSQLEAPFSEANSMDLFKVTFTLSISVSQVDEILEDFA